MLQEVNFPVPGCPELVHRMGRLCMNFIYRPFQSEVVLVQEREEPMPRCDLYIMHMPLGRLIRHQRTVQCDNNTHMRWWR